MAEQTVQVYRMYKYRRYRCDKRDRNLRHMLCIASTIWNHFIALQRRYYRLTGKYINLDAMHHHVLKLRKTKAFALWRDLHSQVCQDVCRRVDDAYQRFFASLAKARPKFRKAKKYRSFTFPQSGYKLLRVNENILREDGKYRRAQARIQIAGVRYKFVQHRPLPGQIKTLTVMRDAVGQLWLLFSVVETMVIAEASTGKSGGFDFGLKTFLVNDEGKRYPSPQFYAQGIHQTRRLNRALARRVEGSNGYRNAQRALARHHLRMANQRREHHYWQAHKLCAEYGILYFEDLNLEGMKRLGGRKVSDLGFAQFLNILEWIAFKRGKTVIKIDRFT